MSRGSRGGSDLGEGGEFDRIRHFLRGLPPPTGEVRLGPGDDGALFGDEWVVSTDLSIEGVHFRLDWITAEEAGFRAAAAGMSDLAAMAAEPIGVLASVAAPEKGGAAEALMKGVRALVSSCGAQLLGGDLTRSPGPLLVDIVVIGRSKAPLLRSEAREGDELWVTGSLGAAAGATALWQTGREPSPALHSAFAAPRPRLLEARWLVAAGVHAGLDLSDGLVGDAGHLAAASEVALVLETDAVPIHPGLLEATLPEGVEARELALHGGEDYELLVAAAPDALAPRVEEFRARFDLSLSRIGRVIRGEGVFLDPGGTGSLRRPERGGYDHFGGDGDS